MNIPYTESSGLSGLALFFCRFAGRATLQKRPVFIKIIELETPCFRSGRLSVEASREKERENEI